MKAVLRKYLEKPSVDRNFKWFWMNEIKPVHNITYQHFMLMLNGVSPLREDVKKTIEDYLSETIQTEG